MQTLLAIFIFCVVLFLYLHIYFHLKTSDDLEVYEICNPSKDKLEEICDLRQPVIFDYAVSGDGGGMGEETIEFRRSVDLMGIKQNYGAFDVKVKNIKDTHQPADSELYVPLTLSSAHQLMKADTASKLISEKNIDFLEETGIIKRFQYSDDFLRPPLVSTCDYDYTFASEGAETQLQYSCCYRNYFMPIQGKAKIILIPPKSTKYLYAKTDYEAFEFVSPVSPWNVQQMYKSDYAKIKTLEVDLVPGKIAFIPAYWWYSIKYLNDAVICSFKYRTYMNTIAILPSLFLHFLQKQNVKRSTVKQVNNATATSTATTSIATSSITTASIATTSTATNSTASAKSANATDTNGMHDATVSADSTSTSISTTQAIPNTSRSEPEPDTANMSATNSFSYSTVLAELEPVPLTNS